MQGFHCHPLFHKERLMSLRIAASLVLAAATTAGAQDTLRRPAGSDGLSLKSERTIAFETPEGTYMDLDVSPDGRLIVFTLLGDIYTVPIGGGAATRLTSGMSHDIQPAWSPDGRSIAYLTDRSGSDNVWVMNADGSNQRPLTRERERALAGVAWSPDGDYVVTRRQGQIWMYHRDGGDGVQLARPEQAPSPMGVTFAPDGRWLYFSSRAGALGGGSGLSAITGWQVRRLDRLTGDVATVTASPIGAFRPVLSPDGKWMAYGARLDAKTGLRLRNLENDQEDWIAYPIDRDNAERPGTLDLMPAYDFTPDGRAIVLATGGTFRRIDLTTKSMSRIAFSARVEQQLGPLVLFNFKQGEDQVKIRNIRYANSAGAGIVFSALNRVWRVDQSGGAPRALVDQTEAQSSPEVSPDGHSVAWVTWDDKAGGHLWRMSLTGGQPQRLTTHAGYYLHPAWSPDGTKIAFVKEDPAQARDVWSRNTGQILWVPSTGGAVQYVTSAPSDNRLTFNSDGSRLYYIARVAPAGTPTPGAEPTMNAEFTSVRLDGTDKRIVARISAESYEAVPSPDARWVAFSVREDVYLAALPMSSEPPTIGERRGPGPVKRITRDGGTDLHWEDGGRTLTWSFADKFYRVNRDSAMAAPEPSAERPDQGVRPQVFAVVMSVPRARPEGVVALRGATVISMKGNEVLRDATVVVTGSRITAVGPSGRVRVPAEARSMNVRGKFIMPGIIDMHAHLRQQRDVYAQSTWSYLANLAYGVTTSRDVSTSNDQFAYGEMVEAGVAVGPRIYSSGRAMTTGNARIESLEDARSIVRHYKNMGATFIKQYAQPHRRQRQWVIQAAKELGLNATNEGIGDLRVNMTMVLDGYSGWEHSLPVADIYGDVIRFVAESKSWYTPTLVVGYGGPTAEWYFYQTTNVHDDAKLARFTPHEVLDRRTRRGDWHALDEFHWPAISQAAAKMLKLGGHVALGAHGEEQGICAHWELWALQAGGLTNHEALRTATILGAEGLGMAADLGSVETGKLADLLVLDRNPLLDIRNSNSLAYVMKNGELFDANTLDRVLPTPVPLKAGRFRDYRVTLGDGGPRNR
jgi:Tol biopolymer transport system component/imidazolonepropionase-like amidohydrolase